MKKLRSLILGAVLVGVMALGMTATVLADATLSDLSVQIQNTDGATENVILSPEFDSSVTEYSATVRSAVTELIVKPTTTDSAATAKVEWNNLDVGANKTYIKVTDAAGITTTYTINTKRLTTAEEATYNPESETNSGGSKKAKSSKSTVTVNKEEMNIESSFRKSEIPEKFSESTYKYKNKEYPSIIGDKKDLIALYLTNDDDDTLDGFYIYNEDKDSFYKMNNIEIRSRMYTIIKPEKADDFLKKYSKKDVEIDGQKVKMWVLDEDESLYLVYAMNWDGDSSLYCYDVKEECFQRYLVSNDLNEKIAATKDASNKLQDKYNNLVDKYNLVLKILAGLVIVILILIFVILNLVLRKKEKNLKKNSRSKIVSDRTYGEEPTFGVGDKDVEIDDEIYDDDEDGLFIDITDEVKKEMEENESKGLNSESEFVSANKPKEVPVINTDGENIQNEDDLREALRIAFPDDDTNIKAAKEPKLSDEIVNDNSEVENIETGEEDDDFQFIDLD